MILLAWLLVTGGTYSVLGLFWAVVAGLPFVPFVYGIGREWWRARQESPTAH